MAKAKKEKEDEAVASSKEERIEVIAKKLEKDFGVGTIVGAHDKPKFHDCISTGSLGLDKALGIGGLPRGRFVEIMGPESSGKTTISLHTIAEAHKDPDSWCAFIDTEHCIDVNYAENLGVDLSRLKISQPNSGEEALEIAHRLISGGDFDVVVLDSVAALLPLKEQEGEMGTFPMGGQARLMSQALRKLTAPVGKAGTIMIFLNQLRDKIGTMGGPRANTETTTGGNALKFYASVRLDVRRNLDPDGGVVMDGTTKVGNEVVVRVKKNKVAPPFREARFDIIYGEGIDKNGEIIKMAVELGIINKAGAWLSYKDKKVQGLEKMSDVLKENEELFEEIRVQVTQAYTPKEFEPTEEETKQ